MARYPVTHRPRLGKSDSSLYSGLMKYVKRHGLETQAGRGGAGKLEKGSQLTDPRRRRQLAKGLARRTTESSRQRLVNRILAGYGQTTKRPGAARSRGGPGGGA
jgi:hypothetical protein